MLSFLHRGIGRRQICSLCLLSLVMFVLTGCWDKKEFNQMAIVQTLAVDKHENEYKVTLQLITPKAGEKGITAEDLWIISGQGESVAAALDQADLSTPRRIYLEQMNFKVEIYTFQDTIKVNIYDDFSINFSELNLQ